MNTSLQADTNICMSCHTVNATFLSSNQVIWFILHRTVKKTGQPIGFALFVTYPSFGVAHDQTLLLYLLSCLCTLVFGVINKHHSENKSLNRCLKTCKDCLKQYCLFQVGVRNAKWCEQALNVLTGWSVYSAWSTAQTVITFKPSSVLWNLNLFRNLCWEMFHPYAKFLIALIPIEWTRIVPIKYHWATVNMTPV